jgi:hypothetical protein
MGEGVDIIISHNAKKGRESNSNNKKYKERS